MKHIDYDGTIKAQPDITVLALLRTILPDVKNLQPFPTDLAVLPHLHADTVYMTTYHHRPLIVHVETQSSYDPLMPLRMFIYTLLILLIYYQQQKKIPQILSVVVWLNKGGRHPKPHYQVFFGKLVKMQLQYVDIPIYDMKWQDLETAALPLAPFCRNMKKTDMAAIGERILREAPKDTRTILLTGFIKFAQSRLVDIDDEIEHLLRLGGFTMSILYKAIKEGEIGMQILKEGEEIGEARGKEIGEARGKEIGEARGKEIGEAHGKEIGKEIGEAHGLMIAITTIWEHRFGAPSTAALQALQGLTLEQLASFLQQTIEASEEELRKKLKLLT